MGKTPHHHKATAAHEPQQTPPPPSDDTKPPTPHKLISALHNLYHSTIESVMESHITLQCDMGDGKYPNTMKVTVRCRSV